MLGVVLWSDTHDRNAVIWCEDHGDLAFYRRTAGAKTPDLDAGDLVQFEVTLHQHRRQALNPRLIAGGVYARLADQLQGVRSEAAAQGKSATAGEETGQAHIIPSGCGQVAPRRGRRGERAGVSRL